MKSALFVDFDNVYTQLRQVQPAAAERFARQPTEWIRWLIESLEIPDGHNPDARRRLLVRRCYLNPNWYQTYRHAFLRAGFEIVDCPPVTAQGKTSTDIHMVLDIIELLQHETRYDEFIVLSADADFTPVLRKLRRYDRRTSVLAIGFPAAAYQASADLLIDERRFIEQALGLSSEVVVAVAADPGLPATSVPTLAAAMDAPNLTPGMAPGSAAPNVQFTAPFTTPFAPATAAPQHAMFSLGTSRQASIDELAAIARRIEDAVAQSPQPVPAGQLALRLRHEFRQVLDDWNGHGTFKPFFRSLRLDHLVWISGSGGRIGDPARHNVETVAVADLEPAVESLAGQSAAGTNSALATAPASELASQPANDLGTDLATAQSARPMARLLDRPMDRPMYRQADGPTERRHDPGFEPSLDREKPWAGHELLYPVAREVCNLTGAPLLAPRLMRAIIDLLCADLAANAYEPTDTARRICEQCQSQHGLGVAMRDVVFILRGMQLNGHIFGRGQDDAHTLANRLVNQVLFLCEREQMVLTPTTAGQIRQWIAGDLSAVV